MKRRIISVVLTLVMILSFAVIGSAKTYGLVFDSSYDAEKDIVSVTIYVEDPGALEAADFCLAMSLKFMNMLTLQMKEQAASLSQQSASQLLKTVL